VATPIKCKLALFKTQRNLKTFY